MVQKMNVMYDDVSSDQLVERLCILKHQPNEGVRCFLRKV